MRQKLALMLTGLLLIGVMAGCSAKASSAQTSYITLDNARSAALAAAGVDASVASITATQLSERDGIAYYEVDFTAAGTAYSYSIDAVTGVVIDADGNGQTLPADDGSQVTDYDTSVADPAGNGDSVTDHDTTTPSNNGSAADDSGGATVVNLPSTKTNVQTNNNAAPSTGSTAETTLEQAKQTALDHAGKSASEVTFVKAYQDFDDGQRIYEIEFISQSGNDYQEYDYEISVSTGKILSYDFDAESYTPPAQGSTTKTEEEVRNIALAKVPGAKAENCSLWLDRDDGRLLYEGKIIYDLMEYEFEIDAYSGTILEWEAESIYD